MAIKKMEKARSQSYGIMKVLFLGLKTQILFIVTLILLILCVLSVGHWRNYTMENSLRKQVINDLLVYTESIDINSLAAIQSNAANSSDWKKKQLKNQLQKYQSLFINAQVYCLELQGTEIFIHTVATDIPLKFQAGQLYPYSNTALAEVFRLRTSSIVEKVETAKGEVYSAFRPLVNQKTGDVILVLGVDLSTEHVKSTIIKIKSNTIAISLILIGIILAALLLTIWREMQSRTIQDKFRHIETYFTVLMGVIVTILSIKLSNEKQNQEEKLHFQYYTQHPAHEIRAHLSLIATYLENLYMYFSHSEFVSQEEFLVFGREISENIEVEAIMWFSNETYMKYNNDNWGFTLLTQQDPQYVLQYIMQDNNQYFIHKPDSSIIPDLSAF